MSYKGIINQSRTLDLAALSTVVDAIAPVIVMFEPEQIGITVVAYMAIRMGLNALAAWLRYKTTGPVGQK